MKLVYSLCAFTYSKEVNVVIRLWMLACLLVAAPLYAGDSTIVEAEGMACTEIPGQPPRTKKQLEDAAREDAKRESAKRIATRIQSSVSSDLIVTKNEGKEQVYTLGKTLSSVYVNADVKELATLKLEPFIDPDQGHCLKVLLRVEVAPKADELNKIGHAVLDDPTLPLSVRIWTDRSRSGETAVYREGEKMRFYLRGNKPFYARIMYTTADGQETQILPNKYRHLTSFQGGIMYVIPNEEDNFELEVSNPLGKEKVTVYASDRPLTALSGNKTKTDSPLRDAKPSPAMNKEKSAGTEFSEHSVDIVSTR